MSCHKKRMRLVRIVVNGGDAAVKSRVHSLVSHRTPTIRARCGTSLPKQRREQPGKTRGKADRNAFLVITRIRSDNISRPPRARNLFSIIIQPNKSTRIIAPVPLLSHLYAPPNDRNFSFRVRDFSFSFLHTSFSPETPYASLRNFSRLPSSFLSFFLSFFAFILPDAPARRILSL